jgi:hypothetical protein
MTIIPFPVGRLSSGGPIKEGSALVGLPEGATAPMAPYAVLPTASVGAVRALPYDWATAYFASPILLQPHPFGLEPKPCLFCLFMCDGEAAMVINDVGEILQAHPRCIKGCWRHSFINAACDECWQ